MKNLKEIYDEAFIKAYNDNYCRNPEFKITGKLEDSQPNMTMNNFFGCGSAWVGIKKDNKDLLAEIIGQGLEENLMWNSYRKEYQLSFCPRAWSNGFLPIDEDACDEVAKYLSTLGTPIYKGSYLD